MRILLFLVPLVLGVYCLVEAISARDDEVRHLLEALVDPADPLLPVRGIRRVAGRRSTRARRRVAMVRTSGAPGEFPEYDRPGRFAAADPAADEEFLKKVRERAEEQRRKAREQKRRELEGDAGGEADPA